MRVLFVGMPDMAIVCFYTLLEDEHNIVGIVPPAASHPTFGQIHSMAEHNNLPCVWFEKSPSEPEFLEKVRALKPDVAVVCSYDKLLPKEFLEIMPYGVINCHPSLLPDYRGGNPYFHVINNNEKYTGITLHYMDSSFDTGDIVLQEKIAVDHDETMGTLFNRLNYKTASLLSEILKMLYSQKSLPRLKQDTSDTYKKAPCIYPENGDTIIDWQKSAEEVERFIRACNPFFGAVTSFRNCQMKIWSADFEDKKSSKPVGQIEKVTKDYIAISTGNGLLLPNTMQIGAYIITDVKDFIKRTRPTTEESFL